jgi:hypothetical protein
MLKYNLNNILRENYFISFYKMGDWNIFVEKNVILMCIQKHKYNPKIIQMIFNFLLKLNFILNHVIHIVEPCLDTM